MSGAISPGHIVVFEGHFAEYSGRILTIPIGASSQADDGLLACGVFSQHFALPLTIPFYNKNVALTLA